MERDRISSLPPKVARALSAGGGNGISRAVDEVRRATGADRVCLNSFSGDRFETVAGSGGQLLDVGTRLPLAASSHLIAAARSEPFASADLEGERCLDRPVDGLVTMHGFRAAAVAPLLFGSDAVGALVLSDREAGRALADFLPLLSAVSSMFALALSGSLRPAALPSVAILAYDRVVGEGIARMLEREMPAQAVCFGSLSALRADPAAASAELMVAPVYGPGRRVEGLAAELREAAISAPLAVYDPFGTALGRAAAAAAGASAYVGPRELASPAALAASLRAPLTGAVAGVEADAGELPPPLTQREREILLALASGRQVKEIASRLGIATATARAYVRSLYAKLDVHSRAEAVVVAESAGILQALRHAAPQD